MKYYACLVPKEDVKSGLAVGRKYCYDNRDKWIECTGISLYLGAGYVKGVDHFVHDGKAYMMMKNFLDVDECFGVFVAVESIAGCDL